MARKLPVWLTTRERDQLLALDLSPRNRAILSVFLFAGLRANELRMLDVGDLDFEAATLHVRHGKRKKERMIPLHPEAGAALEYYLNGRTSGPMFLSNRGGRISYDRLHSLVVDLARRAGIRKHVHPHVLRHTFATLLREAGVELGDVAELLGHVRLDTTRIYDHVSLARKRAAVDRL